MEIYKNKTFPEMEQEIIYTKERELEKTYQSSKSKDREYQQKHRTKEPSRNDIIKQITGEIVNFNNAVNSKLNNKTNIKKYWNFFPTPSQLIEKMLDEYKTKPLPKNILEPSAGKGDIIDYLNKIQNKRNQQSNIYAFEFVPQLQEILKQKRNCKLLGNDFLQHQKPQINFDLIIMNPPFDRGAEHTLHAWNTLKQGGKIIALMNKHTYYNPYNSHRLKLKTIIDQYGKIENLGRCFTQGNSERPANVDVIMVTITKRKDRYYQDLGINLNQYPNEMIKRKQAQYIIKEIERG
jgi:hypothetical protein